jgi:cobalt/nickel transport system permease protein
VHLLLNGLVGVIVGWRAALAIPIAVFLQAFLFSHGGFLAVGVNSFVMTLPALLAGCSFPLLVRVSSGARSWLPSALVGFSAAAWVLSLVFSAGLVYVRMTASSGAVFWQTAVDHALSITIHPATLLAAGLVSAVAVWGERKLKNAPEFAIGLVVGELLCS